MTSTTREFFDRLVAILEYQNFEHDILAQVVKNFCKEHEIKLVTIAQPVRIALTGGTSSPGVFDMLSLLGKEESITRLHALQRFLEQK